MRHDFYGPVGMPPTFADVLGRRHPGFEHGRKVAMQAREQPGEWVDLATGMAVGQARSKVSTVRYRPSAAFAPRGAFEVRAQKRENGYAVQIRYAGEPS